MRKLIPLAAFALAALPALAALVTDPETGLRTGTIGIWGHNHRIEPNADLRGAELFRAGLSRANLNGANLSVDGGYTAA